MFIETSEFQLSTEEDFVVKTESFDGLIARVIQHEYDHIEGILFTDKTSLEKTTDTKVKKTLPVKRFKIIE
jgi:peptide deformylase